MVACLVEKQRTTPDQYPLTLNSLRLACNQSTNRDPVVDYDEATIRSRSIASGGASGRRWRAGRPRARSSTSTCSTRRSASSDPQLALLTVLMLRGPQTPASCARAASASTASSPATSSSARSPSWSGASWRSRCRAGRASADSATRTAVGRRGRGGHAARRRSRAAVAGRAARRRRGSTARVERLEARGGRPARAARGSARGARRRAALATRRFGHGWRDRSPWGRRSTMAPCCPRWPSGRRRGRLSFPTGRTQHAVCRACR